MSDLKKIEKNFHDLINNAMSKNYDRNFEFPKLTRDLLTKEEFVWPRGGFFVLFLYFLKCEDDNCLLYVNARDGNFNELFIIDDNSYKWIKDGDYEKLRSENNIEPKE